MLSLPAPDKTTARTALSWVLPLIRERKGMDWRLQVGGKAYGEAVWEQWQAT
ncbi:MAG: hypothetical protein ACUVWR_18620 [Anaerolineae bacterium]